MSMIKFVLVVSLFAALVPGLVRAAGLPTVQMDSPSFAEFDRRAKAGERLSVVFFGASLTWGANASDPATTSYRAVVADDLERAYPDAHFTFWDAAIGGTGSQLAVFRLDRDVLRRKPDLVFLDFSANDDIYTATPDTLASYESLVRRIVLEARAPVVIVLFPFGWNVTNPNLEGMKRRTAHLEIAKAYGTGVGDAIELAINRVREGAITVDQIWPADKVHPCDEGYRLFADAAWQGFQQAVKEGRVCRAPEKMLYADTYMKHARVRISTLQPLPEGWTVGRPNLTAAWHDGLMSRWLDDECIASNRRKEKDEKGKVRLVPQDVARLKVKVNASFVMLFGEETLKSGRYRIWLDGTLTTHVPHGAKEPVDFYDASAVRYGGNRQHAQVILRDLDTTADHVIEIEPVFDNDKEQELRLESICVAGGKATVQRAE